MKKIITQSGFLFILGISILSLSDKSYGQDIPVTYHSSQAHISAVNIFPNPVNNGEMKLAFYVNQTSQVRVDIYDVAGNLVETPVNKLIPNGPDEELIALNTGIPQGLYILALRNGSEVDAIKFSVIERGSK